MFIIYLNKYIYYYKMTQYERFQRIRDYIDSQNICDSLADFLDEDILKDFCEYLEEEYNVEYDEYMNNEEF